MSFIDRAIEFAFPRKVAPLALGLKQSALFFDALRGGLLGPILTPSEVSGCTAILGACDGWSISWTAYALATAYHETAHTMQPVKEYGGDAYLTRMYDITGLRPDKARILGNLRVGDGKLYAGRGYVQLTGKNNYQHAQTELGVALVMNPELALNAKIAADIMARGMSEGWFTGKKLSDYLKSALGTLSQFTQARRIVNGQDKADDIAIYAMEFQIALQRGLWS